MTESASSAVSLCLDPPRVGSLFNLMFSIWDFELKRNTDTWGCDVRGYGGGGHKGKLISTLI